MKPPPDVSVKFVLPGIFLLLLGIGNIAVGHYKGEQYNQVLEELSEPHPSANLVNASPLRRIEFVRHSANRLSQRQSKARARRDFYQLVTFGGKSFVGLSIVLLFSGLCVRYIERSRPQSLAPPKLTPA